MKKDILIAGVGGQGILSLAYVLDNSALEAGFYFKQTEVHGMAQRGGGVVSHVRISDQKIHSDMIPTGKADIILGIEPLESLRYVDYLVPGGLILTNSQPFINISQYPEIETLEKAIKSYRSILFDATKLAKEAGTIYAENMVLLGALSNFLPMDKGLMKKWVKELFASKGEKIVEINIKAFDSGCQAVSLDLLCI